MPESQADHSEPVDPLELRSTIERQGGRFHVELPQGTHGMRSTIELPLLALAVPSDPHASATAERAAARAQSPSLDGLTVMCTDDHADALDSLGLILRGEGAQVLAFQRRGARQAPAGDRADWTCALRRSPARLDGRLSTAPRQAGGAAGAGARIGGARGPRMTNQ
jgi:hypothetical protein